MATKFDRESFNLLKMTDSGSESVPDHSFEIAHQSRNKKKVRLKRWVHQTKKSLPNPRNHVESIVKLIPPNMI